METLGTLCDKLTIVKLKQWHSEDNTRLQSLATQEKQLAEEIDIFIVSALTGLIPVERLTFSANKVYKIEGNEIRKIEGESIGVIFGELANVNCALWHEQEKVYEFEKIIPEDKNAVVKKLARMNLERTFCIDKIDNIFYKSVKEKLDIK
jgi:hypothetical protein